MSYDRVVRFVGLICAIGVGSACTAINSFDDPALVGSWELDVYADTTMDIDLDGDGDARIFNVMVQELRYDLDWTQEDPDEYEIQFNCLQHPSGSCIDQGFLMKCEASSSGNNLDCKAQSRWDPPDFQWGRDE